MISKACYPLLLLSFSALLAGCSAWFQQEELELFDLVEEVNENFYSLMQVGVDASGADLKKAFRKLSLTLHPDKNDAPDASVKFRQMVAVYEVLKDPEKRKRYDQVLKEGLPDWRQPIFYFRRARKMGFGELSAFLATLLTLGHYLMSWGSYFEQRWTLSEMRQKRKKKKGKIKGSVVEDDFDVDDEVLEKPGWKTLLPILITKHSYWFFKSLPTRYEEYKEQKRYEEELRRQEEEEAAAAAEPVIREPRPKKKRVFQFPEFEHVPGQDAEEKCDDDSNSDGDQFPVEERSGGLWTDDDIVKLGKMMRKYPGAVPGRWEIIARQMSRTVFEVTFMAKKIKTSQPAGGDALVALQSEASGGHQLLPPTPSDGGFSAGPEPDDGFSPPGDGGNVVVERRRKPKHKAPEVAAVVSKPWSQMQQEALEKALQKYTKGVDERWEKISNSVPGKTKEECLERCRELAKNVKKRKEDPVENEGREEKPNVIPEAL